MSDTSAIRLLQTAIENVRETCTGSEYKKLLAACDAADKAAEAASRSDSAEPRTLKEATDRARSQFADKRAAKSGSDGD